MDSGSHKHLHWRFSARKCQQQSEDEKQDQDPCKDSPVRVSVSGISLAHQWRKGSVTIVEGQEPGEGEEDPEQADTMGSTSSSGHQLLTIPSTPLTNSSSAETLTDNTLTGSGPNTPTIIAK